MLIPMYFIIGVWGGERRIYASIKFFIYTFLGSLLMLVAIIYLWLHSVDTTTLRNTFGYDDIIRHAVISSRAALWLFGAFFLAFAVKVPMFPFHTWLPDAHTEAPTAGSVILAGIMLKMGTYGFLRFALPLFPGAGTTPWVRDTILTLAVIGIVYGALVAMVQPDFKKLVAYSSVSHLGFVMLGIFALTLQSVQGALMVMINHGISTGALFLLIGMIYERKHTRLIDAYGGIARVVPMFAVVLTLVSLSSIGLPGTNGFVGEFLVLVGSFKSHPWFTLFATTGVIFAACYLLWAIQRILFNKLDKPENALLPDLNRRELAIVGVLTAAILWIGIYPAPVLKRMERSSQNFVQQVSGAGAARVASVGGRRKMSFDLSVPGQLSMALLPELVLMAGAMLLLLVAAWGKESQERAQMVGSLGILLSVLTTAIVVWMWMSGAKATPGIIAVDGFRWAADLVILIATIIAIALGLDYARVEQLVTAETYVLVLLASAGMMLLTSARDLIMVFLGIELMSIAVYVLAGVNRRSARAAEASLKYFLLGAFSTGFLLYGIALIYGATGSTDLATIGAKVTGASVATAPMLLIGVALLLVGFGFKVAAVPFHMWTPDVYEGAPTPITAYMAAAVKAAAFAALVRVWREAFPGALVSWHLGFWWLAVLTMVVGNLVALVQKNIKRMLAYSSIAHAGYILVAVISNNQLGSAAFLFYVLAYTLATMGAFGVVIAVGEPGERHQQLSDFAGLWSVRPWLAAAMAVFMLALLGFPIAGGMGFFAKWYVLQAALDAAHPETALAIVLVLTSVLSAGYYLAVVMVMFMRPRSADAPALRPVRAPTFLVVYASAIVLLFFGIFPAGFVGLARNSIPVIARATGASSPPTSVARR